MKTASLLFCALTIQVIPMVSQAQVRILYTLAMPRPSSHLFSVSVALEGLPPGMQDIDLKLPVWRPGRYLVLDFAGGVTRFDARSGRGDRLPWQKTDKSTWSIHTAGAANVRADYEVYADEFSQRTRGLNDEHAFVDGTSLFMYDPDYRTCPVELFVNPPAGWHVTTGLESSGTNRFHAPGYDEFADSPLEIGTQKDFDFTVDGVPHVLSIFGGGNWDPDTLMRDIGKIVHANREFWGSLPYRRYVFLLHCLPDGGGGTEHVNSTIMGIQPFVFRNPDGYRGFLGLVSHEYFHTWNVKQLRPAALARPDFQKENYTRELWMAEGTTSYFDGILLVKAGLSTREKFLESVARGVYDDRLRPGNRVQSLAQSGYDAWIKYWRGNRESFNEESDYYGKGAAVSLLLDLEIRHATANARSFADVMRALYVKFPRSGPGYTNADVREEVGRAGGEGMRAVFDSLVEGTGPLAWERVLEYAGLELAPSDDAPAAWTGMDFYEDGGRSGVSRVIAGSPSFESGLDIGDEIVALDGLRITGSGLRQRLKDLRPGESIRLTVFRGDKLREFTVRLEKPPLTPYRIKESEKISPEQKAILDSWLPSGTG